MERSYKSYFQTRTPLPGYHHQIQTEMKRKRREERTSVHRSRDVVAKNRPEHYSIAGAAAVDSLYIDQLINPPPASSAAQAFAFISSDGRLFYNLNTTTAPRLPTPSQLLSVLQGVGQVDGIATLDSQGWVPVGQLGNVGATDAVTTLVARVGVVEDKVATKEDASLAGVPGGFATLDSNGHVTRQQLGDLRSGLIANRGSLLVGDGTGEAREMQAGVDGYFLQASSTDTLGVTYAQVDHYNVLHKGTNTHAQLDGFVNSKDQPNGLASLDGSSYVPVAQLGNVGSTTAVSTNTSDIATLNGQIGTAGGIASLDNNG